MRQYRRLRKILEVSHGERKLLCDGNVISGVGKTVGNYNHTEADLYEVHFRKNHSWELSNGGNVMARVQAGNATLAPRVVDQARFQSDLERILPDTAADVGLLYLLTLAATEKGHGALVIDGLAVPEGDPPPAEPDSIRAFATSHPSFRALESSFPRMAIFSGSRNSCRFFRTVSTKKREKLKELAAKDDVDSTPADTIPNWMEKHAFYLPADICVLPNVRPRRFSPALIRGRSPL